MAVEIIPCAREAWGLYQHTHYLNSDLHVGSQCYLGVWNDTPVAFCASLHTMGAKGMEHITRVVVLPDYQGIGIGGRMLDEVARIRKSKGKRIAITASHPAVWKHCQKSKAWSFVGMKRLGSKQCGVTERAETTRAMTRSLGRSIASFEFIGNS